MSRVPRIPGAAPVTQADDDLSEFPEGGELPAVDPVQLELAAMRSEIERLKRRGQSEPMRRPEREIDAASQDEAHAMAIAEISAGRRPRALLTPDGWYVHPEAARMPGSLGNLAKLVA